MILKMMSKLCMIIIVENIRESIEDKKKLNE